MARGLALTAALAVSLLAVSGASGTATQTPARGGTAVFAQVPPEPACLNPFDPRCRSGTAEFTLLRIAARVLEAPFAVGPDFTWRPRLVSRVDFTRTPPFTLIYHIRPEAHWSDGRPITAGDFVFTHHAILKHGSPDDLNRTAGSHRPSLDAKTVKVVLRSRFAGWRELFGSILPRHALRGRGPAQRVEESHRQPQDRRSNRERPLPRRALGAWQADHASSKPAATGGRILRTSTDSSSASASAPTLSVDGFRAGEFDVARRISAELFSPTSGESAT